MNFKCNGTTINLVEFDKAYPIGSIYMNLTNPDNPATYLGGIWERFGQGRTLIGEGTGDDGTDSQTFTANSTGGEYKHKLTVEEMPSHAHKLQFRGGPNAQDSYPFADNKPMLQGSNAYGKWVDNTGGDVPHNNIQPYVTVYFWVRTA